MKILIIGSGGREHALAWSLARSLDTSEIFIAPGNGGTDQNSITSVAHAQQNDLISWAKHNGIGFVVIGSENDLTQGLADDFLQAGMVCLGPQREAAQLEKSKIWMKQFCDDYAIPTAAWHLCHTMKEAAHAIKHDPLCRILKKDGLAAGKGVWITHSEEEALHHAQQYFAQEDEPLLLERLVEGRELSVFALLDGENSLMLGAAQDYKRAYDGDKGGNTGGMGAISHDGLMDEKLEAIIKEEFIDRVQMGMKQRNILYRGVLFAGLMIKESSITLLEYNVRFGDPECQTLLMRAQTDFLPLLYGAAKGDLPTKPKAVSWEGAALTIVLASQGYPDHPATGGYLTGLDDAALMPHIQLFHAATKKEGNGIIATGGRVLHVTAKGDTIEQARSTAYEAASRINFPKGFYRRDIGQPQEITERDNGKV